ncbi:MAG: glycosyltransferase family 4 protein [Bacteroidetes bacterium]|nr:glycosyltransferase family 4 protein [Bacteroidota bacterium]
MKKIAFIVQRYGNNINGGAELHCRQLAEKLTAFYEVEVLTTCAVDTNWANDLEPGTSTLNKVTVRRFKTTQERNESEMKKIRLKINTSRRLFKKEASTEDCKKWVAAQGPYVPELVEFVQRHEQEYDCLLFYTYLYYPTVSGIAANPAKTIFIPTAHDEWAIYLPIYRPLFLEPAFIMYNTPAEKRFVHGLFNNAQVKFAIAGAGVDLPAHIPGRDVKKDMNIDSDYILYVGRINPKKISREDFKFFEKYVKASGKDIKLVLIGNAQMKIPVSKHILHFGYVDDETKFCLLRQCLFLYQPSKLESLSMVVLEAFMMQKPVLVHKACEVMKDHVDQSSGGFYYDDYNSFVLAMDKLVNDTSLNSLMGKQGKKYVQQNYIWDQIIDRFRNAIETVAKHK